jgi:hypothetical protein
MFLVLVRPGHEVVDAAHRPALDELGEHVGEVGLRIDGVHLAGFDQRGDDAPMNATLVAPGKEGVLAVQRDRADSALNGVGVDLDPAVVDEAA